MTQFYPKNKILINKIIQLHRCSQTSVLLGHTSIPVAQTDLITIITIYDAV